MRLEVVTYLSLVRVDKIDFELELGLKGLQGVKSPAVTKILYKACIIM